MRVATTSIVCSVALLQACTVKDYTFLNVSLITVSPSNPAIPIGATQQFTASGTLSDGSTQDVSGVVTWSSSNPSVATIDGSGTASALAEGTTTIQARTGSVTGSTDLTIRSLSGLTSIVIAPASPPSLPVGEPLQFTATGMYSDGSAVDLTRAATWSSSNAAVASIDAFGLARGLAAGTTTIQASSAGINGTTQLRVVSLASIAVTPMNPTIAIGGTQQFTATGTYSDGTTTRNLTSSVTWTSDLPSIATISPSGLATGVAAGTTIIRARSGTIEGTTTLAVRGLNSITVNPGSAFILVSEGQPFQAIGHFSDGSQVDITQSVSWISDTPSVATINNFGLARGVGEGTSTIRARSASVEGTATISVTGPTSIAVTPSTASILRGSSLQFTATGTFPGGATHDLTQFVTWSSTVTPVATVNPSGVAFGLDYGGTTIQATLGSVMGTAGLTVGLTSLAITPAYPAIPAINGTVQLMAIGTFGDSQQRDVTSFVAWSSTVPAIATIDATGLATGRGLGGTTIKAVSDPVTATATTGLTVGLTSLALTPAYPAIPLNGTQQFTATGTFTSGPQQDITAFVGWSSSASAVATIDGAGLATGRGPGGTTIRAVSGAFMPATGLTVGLTSLAVTPAYPAIPAINGTQQFTATGTFASGPQQNITAFVGWSSTATAVATIDAAGLATGRGLGGTTIQAASGPVAAMTGLTVGLTSLTVTPAYPAIPGINGTLQFSATGTFTDSVQRNVTLFVVWSSSATAVATIDAAGLATGRGLGGTTIQAASGPVAAMTGLTVGLTSLTVTPAYPAIPAINGTQQFTATGTFTDSVQRNVTLFVAWSSSATAVATIDAAGLATGRGLGATTIQAATGAVTPATTGLTVGLSSLALTPAYPAISGINGTQQFTATGTFTDSVQRTVTLFVAWSSSATAVATIDAAGLATAHALGGASIQAASGAINTSTGLTVGLVSMAITPLTATIARTQTQQFTATGTFTSGPQQNITNFVAWSSSNMTVATINASGLATGLAAGMTMIGARSGSIMQTQMATLTVTP